MGTDLVGAAQANYSLPDLQVMARQVAQSKLFGGADTEEAAFTLMLLCQAEGLHPIQAMRRYHIIKGRPSMRADAMQAEFQRHGGVIRWERSDAHACVARFVHATHAPDPGVTISLTMKQSVDCGLAATEMYRKYPDQMLRARIISQGVRMVLPGVVVGIYTPEEIDAINITPSDLPIAREQPAIEDRSRQETVPLASRPAIETPTRASVNVAFPTGEAKPRPCKEKIRLPGDEKYIGAKGYDVRGWDDIRDQEVGLCNQRLSEYRVKDLGLTAGVEALSTHQLLNHMVTAAIEAGAGDPNDNPEGPDKKRKAIGNGKKSAWIHEMYLRDQESGWRDWIRAEIAEYLDRKLAIAKTKSWSEFSGEPYPGDEHAQLDPENIDQSPKVAPEDESQLVAAETGDGDGWKPGRE